MRVLLSIDCRLCERAGARSSARRPAPGPRTSRARTNRTGFVAADKQQSVRHLSPNCQGLKGHQTWPDALPVRAQERQKLEGRRLEPRGPAADRGGAARARARQKQRETGALRQHPALERPLQRPLEKPFEKERPAHPRRRAKRPSPGHRRRSAGSRRVSTAPGASSRTAYPHPHPPST